MDIDTARYSLPLPDLSSWFITIGNWIIGIFPSLISFVKSLLGIIIGISFPLALFFLIGIIYCVENLKKIRVEEDKIYDAKVENGFGVTNNGNKAMSNRWQNVIKHINSDNPNDWKQSIMEADIILDDLLCKMGYAGDSIGDRLKKVTKGDMKSLDEAWEAHKVRNQIAHEGSNFNLNQIEAKNVIGMYRKVFEEFYYI